MTHLDQGEPRRLGAALNELTLGEKYALELGAPRRGGQWTAPRLPGEDDDPARAAAGRYRDDGAGALR